MLYASPLPPPTQQVLRAFSGQGAAAAWVETGGVMLPTMWSWVHDRQRALGWMEGDYIPSGYYLFVGGEVRGHHAGLIDVDDQVSLGIGALLAIGGIFTKNADAISSAFDVAQAEASLRVISYFTQLAEICKLRTSRGQERLPQTPPPLPAIDELARAYTLLGVDEFATQADVKQRYRDLIREWHPDQFAQDPIKCARGNEQLAQINASYDLIMVRRGWT